MTNQVIPEVAVEAAAIEWVGELVWQDCNEAWRADYLERTRHMLEAAAPHMLKDLRELIEDMEAQPSSEIATVKGMAFLIRNTMNGLL